VEGGEARGKKKKRGSKEPINGGVRLWAGGSKAIEERKALEYVALRRKGSKRRSTKRTHYGTGNHKGGSSFQEGGERRREKKDL